MHHFLLSTLHARLLRGDSVTTALAEWCHERGIGNARIVARQFAVNTPQAPSPRPHLQAAPDARIVYRRVQLCCAGLVLVEADNWYLPARLDAQMRRQLMETDIPYGAIIAPLRPVRQILASTLTPDADPVLHMHALVRHPDGQPLAEVIERFRRSLLDAGDGSDGCTGRKTMPEVR